MWCKEEMVGEGEKPDDGGKKPSSSGEGEVGAEKEEM